MHISTAQTKKTPSQERPRDGISLIGRLIATTFRNPSLDMFPQTNRVEAAGAPTFTISSVLSLKAGEVAVFGGLPVEGGAAEGRLVFAFLAVHRPR